jgi:hypothetical protein
VVERDLAKVDVAGSTPVSRSIYAPAYRFHDETSARFASLFSDNDNDCSIRLWRQAFTPVGEHNSSGC